MVEVFLPCYISNHMFVFHTIVKENRVKPPRKFQKGKMIQICRIVCHTYVAKNEKVDLGAEDAISKPQHTVCWTLYNRLSIYRGTI